MVWDVESVDAGGGGWVEGFGAVDGVYYGCFGLEIRGHFYWGCYEGLLW